MQQYWNICACASYVAMASKVVCISADIAHIATDGWQILFPILEPRWVRCQICMMLGM